MDSHTIFVYHSCPAASASTTNQKGIVDVGYGQCLRRLGVLEGACMACVVQSYTVHGSGVVLECVWCCLLLQALQVVWLEGRRLLTLLNSFFSIAAADRYQQAPRASAAAAGASGQHCAQQLGASGASAGTGWALSAVDAAAAATEVAAMLASYLQSFKQASDQSASGPGPHQQQQQRRRRLQQEEEEEEEEEDEDSEGAGGSCCFLLVENLVGPHGAVNYMNRVHQQACINPGRKAATK